MATPPVTPTDPFATLPEALSAELFAKARRVRLRADHLLFQAGDPQDGCYRVNEGLLKVTMASATGGERILAVLGPGSVVGELSMIDGSPRSAGASAVRDSELSFVSAATFHTFAEGHPQVYKHVMTLLARRLRDTNDALAAISFLPLKGRVARALLNLADAFGNDVGSGRILIRQKVTQNDLAAMAGVSRENVSRILNDWKRSSLISWVAGHYCLENRSAIEREARL